MKTYLQERTEYFAKALMEVDPDPTKQTMAELYGFTSEGNLIGTRTCKDVYDLLESCAAEVLAMESDYLMLLTQGWARAIKEDDSAESEVPVSQHPDRRRVFLVLGFTNAEQWAVVGFQGEPEVAESSTGKGTLADCVRDLMERSVRGDN